eukprot:Pompholyxophrys_punicea_v1_NODE_3_length_10569_cov_612.508655.p2 type:complete len:243 gc:universal NODE_3_length_10569_cov_612.508655:8557-9285(+)
MGAFPVILRSAETFRLLHSSTASYSFLILSHCCYPFVILSARIWVAVARSFPRRSFWVAVAAVDRIVGSIFVAAAVVVRIFLTLFYSFSILLLRSLSCQAFGSPSPDRFRCRRWIVSLRVAVAGSFRLAVFSFRASTIWESPSLSSRVLCEDFFATSSDFLGIESPLFWIFGVFAPFVTASSSRSFPNFSPTNGDAVTLAGKLRRTRKQRKGEDRKESRTREERTKKKRNLHLRQRVCWTTL